MWRGIVDYSYTSGSGMLVQNTAQPYEAMTSFNNRSSKSKLGYQLLSSVQAQDHLVRVQFHFDSPSSVPPPSPFRMRIFSGSGSRKILFCIHTCISDDSLAPACFSPSVPDYLLEAWGKAVSASLSLLRSDDMRK